jgi:oligopeptide/dipeptide ABC transporter ATP-binding protein
LTVRDLAVEIKTARGLLRAVDGVSLDLFPGEALGVVGESGCGKSMLLRSILGLLPRAARIAGGEVNLGGREITRLRGSTLRTLRGTLVAMIFQEPMTALNPLMRVGEQIAEGPRAHLGLDRAQARARAIDLMWRVGIPDPESRASAFPHELSGGMRQRVMIAMAISCEPQVLLCDEPTTALDVTTQAQVLDLIRSLRADLGASVVLVTHDLAVVAQMCERVAVMYAGQVVETGEVATVFRSPNHAYTLGLLRSVLDVDVPQEALTGIPGAPPDLVRPPAGCRFNPRCWFAEDDCRSGDFPLLDVAPGHSSACIYSARVATEPSPIAGLV